MAPPRQYLNIRSPLTVDEVRSVLDYELTTGVFRWKIDSGNVKPGKVAGTPNGRGYLVIRVKDKLLFAHRLAWFYVHGVWPTPFIDHKNGNRSDNRIENLRVATKSQNGGNSRPHRHNSHGFKGVYWSRQKRKWVANIQPNRRKHYLGCFNTPQEAHAAYAEAAKQYFGEFARAN